ncbi:hypothetical protein E2C01_058005 [Portunus trituberculatus]|uniref:Uncharacterized protein n=1 Tax=Portunus trituberculatus TaxID=210409 RepID=A0A5B7H3H8_PORTR|nr:hypothetical protein [Portunus trituberculatus]
MHLQDMWFLGRQWQSRGLELPSVQFATPRSTPATPAIMPCPEEDMQKKNRFIKYEADCSARDVDIPSLPPQ